MPAEILVLSPTTGSPFVEADVAALRTEFAVDHVTLDQVGSKLGLIAQVSRRLARRDVGCILMWFLAPAYSLEVMALARLHRVPVAVITGGLDVDVVPQLNLGGLRWPHNRLRQKLGLRRADLVLAMSDWSAGRIKALVEPRALEIVPMGVDTERFTPGGAKEQLVLTVCFSVSDETALLKGVTTFVSAAAHVPEARFVLVGRSSGDGALDRLRASATANVEFVDRYLPDDELLELFQRAKVYVQVSAHEGFGLAAAEAMACGALVVGAGEHALRDVVGDTGRFVPYGDVGATADAVRELLAYPADAGSAARTRIESTFPFDLRAGRLREVLRPMARSHDDGRVRVDLGCGDNKRLGTVGVDARPTRAADVVCDVRHTPFDDSSVDVVYATCLLEHFADPYEVLDEIVRVMKPEGEAVIRLPNLGTFSAHLDIDHKFLADLRMWREILSGYFEHVRVKPLGVKYRDNKLLAGLMLLAVRGLRFHELAQGWDLVCAVPRVRPERRYTGWWMEGAQHGAE